MEKETNKRKTEERKEKSGKKRLRKKEERKEKSGKKR